MLGQKQFTCFSNNTNSKPCSRCFSARISYKLVSFVQWRDLGQFNRVGDLGRWKCQGDDKISLYSLNSAFYDVSKGVRYYLVPEARERVWR